MSNNSLSGYAACILCQQRQDTDDDRQLNQQFEGDRLVLVRKPDRSGESPQPHLRTLAIKCSKRCGKFVGLGGSFRQVDG